MATVRELITKIIFRVDDRELKRAEKSVSDFTKKVRQAGRQGQRAMDRVTAAANRAGTAGTRATSAMGR